MARGHVKLKITLHPHKKHQFQAGSGEGTTVPSCSILLPFCNAVHWQAARLENALKPELPSQQKPATRAQAMGESEAVPAHTPQKVGNPARTKTASYMLPLCAELPSTRRCRQDPKRVALELHIEPPTASLGKAAIVKGTELSSSFAFCNHSGW